MLIMTSCGDAVEEATTTSIPPTGTTAPQVPTTIVSASTTSFGQTTTTSIVTPTTSTTLGGTPVDFGPAQGDRLMVIGVRYDDILNLRAGPGADQPIRAQIPATFANLVATGRTRRLPSSFWTEVGYDGSPGWVNMSYVGYEGDVTDDTSAVVAELGKHPVETTMPDLGELIAALYAATDGPESVIVQVTEPTFGDLAEITYDVVGLGDDAVRGVRIHLFAEETDGGFALKSVEVMAICDRGVDTDRACV